MPLFKAAAMQKAEAIQQATWPAVARSVVNVIDTLDTVDTPAKCHVDTGLTMDGLSNPARLNSSALQLEDNIFLCIQ